MKDFTPVNIALAAKPTTTKAKRPYPTVTVTYGMSGEVCPTRRQGMHAAEAPRTLIDFVRRIATAEGAEVAAVQTDARNWLTSNAGWLPAEETREGREETDHG